MARDRPGPFFVSAPAGAELEIRLNYHSTPFEYSYPLSGWEPNPGSIMVFSTDGRSMFLFEGTATGPFDVRSSYSNVIYTVTPDEDGFFSVLLPYCSTPSFGAPFVSGNTIIYNDALTTVTRYPDYFETLTSMNYLFGGCRNLTSVPDLGFTSRVRSFKGAFRACVNLVSAPWVDMSNATSVSELFYNCYKLESVPDYDTGKVTDFSYMFTSCKVLSEFPDIDTSKGTSFRSTFYDCDAMTEVPIYDYSSGQNFQSFAATSDNLRTVGDLEAVLN